MKILSVNAGSSSLKFTLFEMDNEEVIISGLFERIGISNGHYVIKYKGEKIEEYVDLKDHTVAVNILLEKLLELKVINSLDEIDGIGHRVAQGGAIYKETVMVTDEVVENLLGLAPLAPLHNPAHVLGINAFRKVLPNTPMTVVFDTAFHQTIAPENYIYPVPYEWYEKYQIRRYGFHGTSHRYITDTISEVMGRKDLRIISCHLGNGGSIAAIKDGKCIDTTMGLTPLAGIVMGSRCGDIDVSIIPYIMKKENLTIDEVWDILNKKSGLLGVSGVSSDCRDVEKGAAEGDERCQLALDLFTDSVIRYIAEYYVELGGCDVICFTAGIGENGIVTRKRIIDHLGALGAFIDEEKNNVRGKLQELSADDSKVKIYLVPTNEELMIARDTLKLITQK